MELVAEKYKKSEVGLIPSDWDVFKLGDCLLRNPDYGINAAAVEYDDTLPTYLRITDISEDGKFIRSNKASVNNSLANAYYLEKGDIVFARTGASVGKTYLYNENDGRLVFAGFLIRITPNPEIVDCFYLIYLTQTKAYWAWVSANSMRSGQPGLNSNEYKSFQISLPPTKAEQTLIATALSDADALISSLEKLITKKRNIKQGAMQKLLQPKEGWEEKKIKEIFQFRQGIQCSIDNQKSDDKEGLQRFIRIIDLTQASEPARYIDDPGTSYHVDIDDLFMVRYGNPGLLGYGFKGVIANNLFRLIPKIKMSNKYFYYLLSYKNEDILQLTSSTTMAALNFTSLNSLKLCFPLSIDEQKNIVSILNDMDNEITSLEKKLSKSKMLKQGMMQELLTGKIRLI